MKYTRSQSLDCLRRQNDDLCSLHCPLAVSRGGMCPVIGESDQYENYMELLRDPAIPADRAAPLLAILDRCAHMDNSMCDDCPNFSDCGGSFPGKVFHDAYDLCREFNLYSA